VLWIWPEDRRHQTTSSTDLRAMAKIPIDTQPSFFKFDEPGDSVFSNSLEQIATVTAYPTCSEGMVANQIVVEILFPQVPTSAHGVVIYLTCYSIIIFLSFLAFQLPSPPPGGIVPI
jgi:hypothetical protein